MRGRISMKRSQCMILYGKSRNVQRRVDILEALASVPTLIPMLQGWIIP